MNDILDDKEILKIKPDFKNNLKKIEFTIFGRTFLFESFIKGNPQNMFEQVEVCVSSEQTAWSCNTRMEREERERINASSIITSKTT